MDGYLWILEFSRAFESADHGQWLLDTMSQEYFESVATCTAELKSVARADWQHSLWMKSPVPHLANVLVSQLYPRVYLPVLIYFSFLYFLLFVFAWSSVWHATSPNNPLSFFFRANKYGTLVRRPAFFSVMSFIKKNKCETYITLTSLLVVHRFPF